MNDPAERLYTAEEALEIAKIYHGWKNIQIGRVDDLSKMSTYYKTILGRMKKYPAAFESEINSLEKAGVEPITSV